MKSARQTAFEILLKMHRNGAYSNLELDSALRASELDKRDTALVSALVYGVLERLITIDYNIEKHLTGKLKKLKPEVLVILRIGAYQILFSDKIPVSAAVNESVKLAKSNRCAFAAGLCNAVLRAVSKDGLLLPDESDKNRYLSVKYSFPVWLCELWQKAYGEENAEKIMASAADKSPVTIRVNTLKTNSETLTEILEGEGVTVTKAEQCENALEISGTGSIESLKSFKDGLFHVQGIASQLCVKALNAQKGMTVFDVCSAPGGKTFTAAEYMENEGDIKAFDIYEHRAKLVEKGSKKLGIDIIKAGVADAQIYNEALGQADRVLCDVPCSGLGIVCRKPEIRYKDEKSIDNLPDLQYRILECSAKYVKSKGKIIYSTCTLNPSENGDVCKRFLENHHEFRAVKPLDGIEYTDNSGFLTLMPHIHGCDGFFIAAFERTE